MQWRDRGAGRTSWLAHGAPPPSTEPLTEVTSQLRTIAGRAFHVIGTRLGAAGSPPAPADPGEPPLDFADHHLDPAQGAAEPLRVQRCGVYAVVVAEQRVLLTRLVGRRQWTLPGGGVDLGEHPEQALRRELDEETGLRLLGAAPAELRTSHWTGRAPNGRLEDFHAVRLIYRGEVGAGEPVVVEVDGTSEAAAWVPLARLTRLSLTPSLVEVCRSWPELQSGRR